MEPCCETCYKTYHSISTYALPFFPDYTIDIPSRLIKKDTVSIYDIKEAIDTIVIKNKKGKIIKRKSEGWSLKNPLSENPNYRILFNKKNVIGSYSQTIYLSEITDICKYLKIQCNP